jgi:heat shock protein HslJ
LRAVAVLAVAGSLLAAAAGCGGDDEGSGPALEGTAWTLAAGVDAPDSAVPTLTLADGTASGFAGCNNYTGGYELDGDSIAFGPLASTRMACPNPEMATESAYLAALESVDSWAVADNELVLSAAGGEVLRFSAG